MGKKFIVALGAGVVAGLLVYVYDTTVGPMVNQTLQSVTGGAK